MNNNVDKKVYLLGTKFADTTADLVDIERIIPPKHHYYFPTDALAINAIQKMGMNGSELVPFIVYIRDHLGHKYEARFGLRINVKQGSVEIHTQQLGLQKTNSKMSLKNS